MGLFSQLLWLPAHRAFTPRPPVGPAMAEGQTRLTLRMSPPG
jgi:hypothetical protein